MSGAELIMQERHRQVRAEGWTDAHDQRHNMGELAEAGACYARTAASQIRIEQTESLEDIGNTTVLPVDWPWSIDWWKPTPDDLVRQLTKAGALIAAEIDRLQAPPKRRTQ